VVKISGAAQPERAEQFVWRVASYNFVFLMSVNIVLIVIPGPIISFFTQQPDTIAHAVSCLRWLSFGLGLFAIVLVLNQAFNGAGDTMPPPKINFIAF
jgi:Na+-driven multidrug efflux pump